MATDNGLPSHTWPFVWEVHEWDEVVAYGFGVSGPNGGARV